MKRSVGLGLALCGRLQPVEGNSRSKARQAPRQRLQVDEDGFILVQRRRRKAPAASPPETSAPDYRRYRLSSHEEETAYRALARLEEAQPDLRVRFMAKGDEMFLSPEDEASVFCLSRLAREG